MRVLIVDDERSLLLTLAANLELEGFEVTGAESARQALDLLRAERFDLVLSDINMPGMNGVEMFRRIRGMDVQIPVVLMTAFALEELIDDAILGGAFTVVPKPFNVEHLVRTLSRAVRGPLVLLVDEAEDADATAASLRRIGVRAAAAGPEAAVSVLAGEDVDVCVVDVSAGGGRAADVMTRIRAQGRDVAIVALAGSADASLSRDVARLGAHAYVRKPFSPGELIHLIAKLRGRPTRRIAAAPPGPR